MVALIWTRKSTKSSKLRVAKNQISIGRLVSVPLVALLITVNGFVLLGTPATATGTVTTYSQSAVINPPPPQGVSLAQRVATRGASACRVQMFTWSSTAPT